MYAPRVNNQKNFVYMIHVKQTYFILLHWYEISTVYMSAI